MTVTYFGKNFKAVETLLLLLNDSHVARVFCMPLVLFTSSLMSLAPALRRVVLFAFYPAIGRRCKDLLQHARRLLGGNRVDLQTCFLSCYFVCYLYALMR